MAENSREERFLNHQIEVIRRFQRLRASKSPEEAQRLALEWINRFAAPARSRWSERGSPRPGIEDSGHKNGGTWKT